MSIIKNHALTTDFFSGRLIESVYVPTGADRPACECDTFAV